MFRILYMCVKGLFVASVRSSRACLTTGPLIVLLGFNYLLYRQSTAPRYCLRCISASSACFLTTSGASGRVLCWLQVVFRVRSHTAHSSCRQPRSPKSTEIHDMEACGRPG